MMRQHDPYKTIAIDVESDEAEALAADDAAATMRSGLRTLLLSTLAVVALVLGLLGLLAVNLPRSAGVETHAWPEEHTPPTATSVPAPTATSAPAPTALPTAVPQLAAAAPAIVVDPAPARTFAIETSGDDWQFAPPSIAVHAGDRVEITYTNRSTQRHNWVLARGGDDAAALVSQAGAEAGRASNYLPADRANILASTALLRDGASETVSFTAPAAGSYTFLCTVPGHFDLGMSGALRVE